MIMNDDAGRSLAAWRVPPIGSKADEAMPEWLVAMIADRRIGFSSLGGLRFEETGRHALPGDTIVLDPTLGVTVRHG